MPGRDPMIHWPESRAGAALAALGLIALGLVLSIGGFALSRALGGATTVVAVAPFVLAVRLLARAFRGKLWVLGAIVAGAIALVWITVLSAPFAKRWDPTGETAVSHAEPIPAEAAGEFFLPDGDPGIPGIWSAFVRAPGNFDRTHGDEVTYLSFVAGRRTNTGYVATDIVRTEGRFRMPWDGTAYQRVMGHCAGTATYDDDAWTLSFTDPGCRVANGRYPRRHPAR